MSLVTALVLTCLDYGNATLIGLARELNRLQSDLHATARLVFGSRKYEHVTRVLQELHWLLVPDRITFKVATLVFRSLHGTLPAYLADMLQRVTDVDTRRRLLSGWTTALVVPTASRRTVGDRAFFAAALRVWNSLPTSLTSLSSLSNFNSKLKTVLFEQSYS